jgi:hypothetical protein
MSILLFIITLVILFIREYIRGLRKLRTGLMGITLALGALRVATSCTLHKANGTFSSLLSWISRGKLGATSLALG